MKKTLVCAAVLAVVALVYGLPPSPADASENLVASLNDGGTGIRTFTARGKGMVAITLQCPSQVVYVRAGCPGCSVDASVGDVSVDFTAGPDSYPFPLASNLGQDRIHVRRNDAGVVECYFYQVAQ